MTEDELRIHYEAEKTIFQSWGEYVQKIILNELAKSEDINLFLKILPQPRLKTVDSLIAKALHRQKNYDDPYNDITDKVGIRFVVLLTTNIKKIVDIIEKFDGNFWRASKDRDYEEERENHPEEFTYESKHYVVYNRKEFEVDSVTIPVDTPCEIQIRTLLQHAYAEMAHDTTYKPKVKINCHVKRNLARSMALVDSADCFFIKAQEEIVKQSKPYTDFADLCYKYYPEEFSSEVNNDFNSLIIDTIYELLKEVSLSEIEGWLIKKKTCTDTLIRKRYKKMVICRQPAILLIYFLIEKEQVLLRKKWKWPLEQLELLESDMGVSPIIYGH